MTDIGFTEQDIQSLCGQLSYKKGLQSYRAGRVVFSVYDPVTPLYKASVKAGKDRSEVTVEINRHGDIEAECSCPTLDSYDKYCKHTAAVLLQILAVARGEAASGPQASSRRTSADQLEAAVGRQPEASLSDSLLELFGSSAPRQTTLSSSFDSRTPLALEILCRTHHPGSRRALLGLELKLGPERLYAVPRLRDFLRAVEAREAHALSRHFTYDPAQHSFGKEHHVLLQQLIQVQKQEQLYLEAAAGQAAGSRGISERMLLIPPASWEALLPLLMAAPGTLIEQDGFPGTPFQTSTETLPLTFEFDETADAGYRLDIHGLEQVAVLELYGMALCAGRLHPIRPEDGRRLAELKQMLAAAQDQRIAIEHRQMEAFMERVVPGFLKLGQVKIAPAIADRITQTPLKARLYLDRVRDRMLAGLEFHYGDIVINPLEDSSPAAGTSRRLLMRDGERERRILELMDQSDSVRTEGGYILTDDDSEYEFLRHIVPRLEELLEVYATSAVRTRIVVPSAPPKLRLSFDERTDWLEIKFEMDSIPESDIRKLLRSLEEKMKFHKLPGGALLPLESSEFQEIIAFMNEVGIRYGDWPDAAGGLRLPAVRALHLSGAQDRDSAVQLSRSLRQFLNEMRHPDQAQFPVPAGLAAVLRDYQEYGYQWMRTLARYRFGGILADDMGLGKTVQSITFIASFLEEIREHRLPALIVCPASLVYNWRQELRKFAPQLRVVIADGSRTTRSAILHTREEADVVITSYPLLRRDVMLYTDASFHTLILDEAQTIKNHATQTAQAVKHLQARYRFALTGTPIENRLEELWSIFDAVFPELFPARRAFNELPRETVAKRARPFLLRRLKRDVLQELPGKIESLHASELLPEQKKLYAAYLAKLQQETLKHLNDQSFERNRIRILAGLTRLRQLCCHPALFVEGYAGSSSKFEQLLELLSECRSAGKRILVFSQFTEMLGLIRAELAKHAVPYFYLDGSTPSAERVELCSRFNEGERDIFLLSLKAGGTGLNLTGADTVILYDLWWNPAVEEQAADRAHRIGQRQVVQVIRLVSQGTVEDKMYALQQRKKNLIEEVVQPGEEALSALTEEEIRELLMIV